MRLARMPPAQGQITFCRKLIQDGWRPRLPGASFFSEQPEIRVLVRSLSRNDSVQNTLTPTLSHQGRGRSGICHLPSREGSLDLSSPIKRGKPGSCHLPSREREVWSLSSPVKGEGGLESVISRQGRGHCCDASTSSPSGDGISGVVVTSYSLLSAAVFTKAWLRFPSCNCIITAEEFPGTVCPVCRAQFSR